MARTTLDLDAFVLKQLRRLSRRQKKSMGQVASEILIAVLKDPDSAPNEPFRWTSKPMGARVDLEDKEAVRRLLDVV